MRKPLSYKEGLILRESAIIKVKEELAAVFKNLYRVRNTRRDVLEATRGNIIDEVAALGVNCGYSRTSVENVGPFVCTMPYVC